MFYVTCLNSPFNQNGIGQNISLNINFMNIFMDVYEGIEMVHLLRMV